MRRVIRVLTISSLLLGHVHAHAQSSLGTAPIPLGHDRVARPIDPDCQMTLLTLNERAVRRLLDGLPRSRSIAGTPVLVWLLAHGNASYVGNVVYQLSQQELSP